MNKSTWATVLNADDSLNAAQLLTVGRGVLIGIRHRGSRRPIIIPDFEQNS